MLSLLTVSVTGLDQGAEEGSLGTCETVIVPSTGRSPLLATNTPGSALRDIVI